MKTEMDAVWAVSEKPDIKRINDEFARAGGLATSSVCRVRNDRIRFNKWEGRSVDYKKHRANIGSEPVPYEDAWDGRVYLADGIVEDLGDVLRNAFTRAQFKMKPGGGDVAASVAKAGNAEKVMNKFVDRDRAVLDEEAEFIWQWGLGYGVSVWQVGWRREVAMKMVPVAMDQLQQAADAARQALEELMVASQGGQGMSGGTPDGAGGTPALQPIDSGLPFDSGTAAPSGPMQEQMAALVDMATFPERLLDPTRDAETAQMFQHAATQLAAQLFTAERGDYGDGWLKNYELSDRQARRVVRDLRDKGSGEFPAPYLHKNQPEVVAREVGYDYFAPPEMTDAESSPWHIVREWLTAAQILENKVTDGWDADWCEEAIKTAGQTTVWGDDVRIGDVQLEDDVETFQSRSESSKSGLVEVLHCFARYTTTEGIPQIWCTVYCPHALKAQRERDEIYAKHYALPDSSSYGFFPFRWQKKRRNFHQNIGIPELVGSDQQLVKRTLDQLTDRGDNELNPPWLVANRLAMRYKAGAGAQIPIKRRGDVEPMPPPAGSPELGFELIKEARYRLDNYFGLMTENVLPAKWQTKLQAIVGRYLGSSAAMFKHYWRLIQRNADPATLDRIAGGDANFPRTPEELEGEYDVALYFDVKDLDMEFVFKKLDAVTKMAVPLDRAGVIDLSSLVKLIVVAIDPTYANALIQDKPAASHAMYREVDGEMLRMSQGNEADFVENDPAAEQKLQFLEQVIRANPKYMQRLALPMPPDEDGKPQSITEQPDMLFIQRVTKYRDNLQQSVVQQENKTTGKLGVKPDNMQAQMAG